MVAGKRKKKRQARAACCDAGLGIFSAALLVSSTSDEPESPRYPEEWLSDELLDARAEPAPASPLTLALALGTGGTTCSSESESPSSEASRDTPSSDGLSHTPDTPFFTIGSRTRAQV